LERSESDILPPTPQPWFKQTKKSCALMVKEVRDVKNM